MVYDPNLPSFIIPNDNKIDLTIPLTDAKPSLFLRENEAVNITIPLSDQTPNMTALTSTLPHINSIFDIKIPVVTPPPTPGTGSNFQIGWWMYVNSGPFVPNNTNFGPGWFMYSNSQ